MVYNYFHIFFSSEQSTKVATFAEKNWMNKKLSLVLLIVKPLNIKQYDLYRTLQSNLCSGNQ